MIAFSDDIEEFVPPKKGRKHVLRVISDILEVQPKGKGTNWQKALETAGRVLRRRSVVLFVSDFVGLPDLREMKVFGRRHDVIPVWLTDPMEERLPDLGFLWARDPESGNERLLDTARSERRARGLCARRAPR